MSQLMGPMMRPLTRWAEQSQQQACRNAMVASTTLTAGRRERDEVQEFVEAALARPQAPSRSRASQSPSGPARLA